MIEERKAEINNVNKVKFFASYWGQKVMCGRWKHSTNIQEITFGTIGQCHNYYLLLKPLSSITDEDAILLANGSLGDNKNEHDLIKHSKNFIIACIHVIGIQSVHADFLRSRGYAVPWMGLSVEEMIDAGWVKLVES